MSAPLAATAVEPIHRRLFFPVLALGLLVMLAIGGIAFHRKQMQLLRQQVATELTTIGALKVEQLAAWRRERLSDAYVLMENRFLAEAVATWRREPAPVMTETLLRLLRSLRDRYRYKDVWLVDPMGRIELSATGAAVASTAEEWRDVATALRDRRPLLSDLHRDATNPAPHMNLIAPLLLGATDPTPVAALILTIDAPETLYPLIQRWPRPSASAESLLVGRDGDQVLFLNELRHRPDAALALRLPLSRPDLPAAQAILGQTGLIEGRDYRGIEVLAAAYPVPDSPWFLIAKVDRAEIFAGLKRESLLLGLAILGAWVILAASLWELWRRRIHAHLQQIQTTAAALRDSEARLRFISEQAPVLITWIDRDLRIRFANQAYARLLGVSVEALTGRPLREVLGGELYGRIEPQVTRVLSGRSVEFEIDWPESPSGFKSFHVAYVPEVDAEQRVRGFLAAITDLTERKAAELALRAAADRYNNLLAATKDAFFLVEAATGRLLDVNPAATALTGFTREELLSMTVPDLDPDRSPDRFQAHLKEIKAVGWGLFETRHRTKGGATIDVEVSVLPEANGETLVAFVRNISERKRLAQQAATRAHVLGLSAKGAPLPEVLDAVVRDIEAAAPDSLCSVELLDGSGRHLRVAAAPHLPDFFNRAVEGLEIGPTVGTCGAAAHFGRRVITEDIRLDPNWAAYQDLAVRARLRACWSEPIISAAGKVLGTFAVYHRDPYSPGPADFQLIEQAAQLSALVIERLRAVEALRVSERRFRGIIESSPVPMMLTDAQQRITYLNPAFTRTFGYTLNEIPTLETWWQRAYPDPEYRARVIATRDAHIERALRDHAPFEPVELTVCCKDGTRRTVIGARNALVASGEETHVITLHDITERKRAEAELTAAKTAADQANQAKSRFLAHMSHEIRTPLNAILGLTQVLARDRLRPDQREIIEGISESGVGLLRIIDDILDFSRVEAGQIVLDRTVFRLDSVLQRIESLGRVAAQEKGLYFHLEWTSPAPLTLVGDDLRVQQILSNLVSNAIKFTEQGGVTVRVLRVAGDDTSVRLRFEVDDTGIGIAPDDLGRLFQAFTQADASITRRFGGTGLGLSIAKGLVDLMGGQIGVESTPGRGSRFWVELPFGQVAADLTVATAAETRTASQEPRLTGLRVLVVDDNRINLLTVERALKLEHAEVERARNGAEALQMLRADPGGFDVVLMDIQMPVMDGLTATRMIRADPGLAGLPIIVLTAGVLAEERAQARAAGADGFLPKPLDLEQMVAQLQAFHPARAAMSVTAPSQRTDARPAAGAGSETGVSAIPGIDREQAIRSLGPDRDFLLSMLRLFVAEFGELAATLRSELAAGQHDEVLRRLHALRGTAGNLGATEVVQAAEALETAVRAEAAELGPLIDRLGDRLATLAEASRAAGAAATPLADGTPPPPPDPARLAALCAALRRHDLVALDLYAELEAALIGVYGMKSTQTLGAAIQALRFEDALAQLEAPR